MLPPYTTEPLATSTSGRTWQAWVLAVLPVGTLVFSFFLGIVIALFAIPLPDVLYNFVHLPFVWTAAALLAYFDSRELRRRGFGTAGWGWVFLFVPILYIALRARALKASGVKSSPIELVAGICFALVFVANYAINALYAATL